MAKVFLNKNSIYYIIRQPEKIVTEPRKNLSSFFHQIKFIVSKKVWLKNRLLRYSATSFFFTDICRTFSHSLILVGFRATLMSFLSFLSHKPYPGEFLRPEVILSRSYLRNCCIWSAPPTPTPLPPIIINLSFFNYLELEANIFRIFISLWYLPLVKISKKSMR